MSFAPQVILPLHKSVVGRLVDSHAFNVTINLSIIASALMMGVQSEISASDRRQSELKIFEHVFTAIFAFEMVLKIYRSANRYFSDPWSYLDFAIAWVSIVSTWILPMLHIRGDGRMGIVRVFRLLRLLRILKIMKAIPELRIVVEGLVSSMRALFWVVLLLVMVVYGFAIFFVEMVGQRSDLYPGYDPSSEGITSALAFTNFNSFEYFGSVQRSMATLFSISLLAEWDSFRPIWEFQAWIVPIFLLLIFVTSFGIVNVIIGVIVERTTASMSEIEASLLAQMKGQKMREINEISDDLWLSDHDGNNQISKQEMLSTATDPAMLAHFQNLDLPKGFTFEDIFEMLNLDGMGDMTRKEFEDGMHRIIFGSEFQKTCLTLLGMGQIKVMSRHLFSQQQKYFDKKLDVLHAAIAKAGIGTQIRPDPPVAPDMPAAPIDEGLPAFKLPEMHYEPCRVADWVSAATLIGQPQRFRPDPSMRPPELPEVPHVPPLDLQALPLSSSRSVPHGREVFKTPQMSVSDSSIRSKPRILHV